MSGPKAGAPLARSRHPLHPAGTAHAALLGGATPATGARGPGGAMEYDDPLPRSSWELLRARDNKIRRDAARYLLALLRRREQRGRDEPSISDSLENLDHGELERLLSLLEIEDRGGSQPPEGATPGDAK